MLIKRLKIIALNIIIALYLAFNTNLAYSQHETHIYTHQFYSFGTEISISIITTDKTLANNSFNDIESYFNTLNTELFPWTPGGLFQLNKDIFHQKKTITTPLITNLIKHGKQYNIQSQGLFEPAIGNLIKLWQFDNAANIHKSIPSTNKIDSILSTKPSITNISIDGLEITSSNHLVQLDFGGFAKGFAVDEAIKRLKAKGITNAIVNAGGDLKAAGSKFGSPWVIGINNPFGNGAMASVNVINNESVFTSGNYERFFIQDSKRYHHIIDPHTGSPAIKTASVTVIDKSGILADAAATAILVAGPERWYEIAKNMGIKYVMLVDNQGIIYMNPRMAKRINFKLEQTPSISISNEL